MMGGNVLYAVLTWTVFIRAVTATSSNFSDTEELRVKLGEQMVKLTCPLLKKSAQEAMLAVENRSLSYTGNAPLAKRLLDLKPFDTIMWIGGKANILVSAASQFDNRKYDYHASTGQLVLKTVEEVDVGSYHCLVTYGQGDPATSSRPQLGTVILLLGDGKTGFASGWYVENETNIARAAIAAGVAGCVISALCILCRYGWHTPRKSQLVITNSQGTAGAKRARTKSKSTNTINMAGVEEDGSVMAVCAIDFDDDDYDEDNDDVSRREFNFKSNQNKLRQPLGSPQPHEICTCHLHGKTAANCAPSTKTHLGNSIPSKPESHHDKSSYPLSVTSTRAHSAQSSRNPSVSSKL